MKVSIKIDYLSAKKLALIFVLLWGAALIAAFIVQNRVWVAIAFALILPGLFLWTRDWHLVLKPEAAVLDRVKKALRLIGLPYEVDANRITLNRPRATAEVRPFGEFALLSLHFDDDKKLEGVLRNAVLKMMRQS